MAVTRSRAVERAEMRRVPRPARRMAGPGVRRGCWRAALLVGAGAVPGLPGQVAGRCAQVEQGLAGKKLLNLNELTAREDLLPALCRDSPTPRARGGGAQDLLPLRQLCGIVGAHSRHADGSARRTSSAPLKPHLRGAQSPGRVPPATFAALWAALFFAAFLLAHVWWSVRGFRGDQSLLPAILLLTGMGLILMVSLRDPVRDNLLFVDFAQGAVGGCVLLAAAEWSRLRAALRQAQLRAAAGEFRALGAAGALRHRPGHQRRQGQSVRLSAGGNHPRFCWCFSWPATSRSRGTCCGTRAKRGRPSSALTDRFDIPPVEYTLPVLVCGGALAGLLLPAKRHGAGAGLCLPVPGRSTGSRAAARSCPLSGWGCWHCGFALRVPHRRAPHGRRARLHVAFAVGQRGARRRSAGAFALGLRHRRRIGHGHRAGRCRNWCRPRTPT